MPRHLIDMSCKKIRSKAANCQLLTKNTRVYLDRGRLFIMKRALIEFNDEIPIKLGRYVSGCWNIHVREISDEETSLSGWKEAWLGFLQVQVSKGDYMLKKGDSSLSKWWTHAKIPAFMRWGFPILASKNALFHEFLTQRYFSHKIRPRNTEISWLISLTYMQQKDSI